MDAVQNNYHANPPIVFNDNSFVAWNILYLRRAAYNTRAMELEQEISDGNATQGVEW